MIFANDLRPLDYGDLRGSLSLVENHLRAMQEQLEYTLSNLDSANVTSLDPAQTAIASAGGSMRITDEALLLTGEDGQRVELGRRGGAFRMLLAGKGGGPALWLDGQGRVTVGGEAQINIDCGRWD